MSRRFLFVVVLMVAIMLSVTACDVFASTSTIDPTMDVESISTPEVMPTIEPTEEVARYSCPEIDPNVEYSIRGIGKVMFFCDVETGYVMFSGDDDTTIIGRAGLNTYKPMDGESVEVRATFDQIDPKDNAVIRHMDNCFVEGQAISAFPVTEIVDQITYQSVRCANEENTIEVTAWYHVRPISSVIEAQPRYAGEILNWEETKIGEDLVFCTIDDPLSSYLYLYPTKAIQQFLPEHEARVVGCFPGGVADVETRRISYQGYALKEPSYNDPESNVLYVLDETQVVGGYPFVAREQLLTGKGYLLCQAPGVHEPKFETNEIQDNFYNEDSSCVLGFYQGIKSATDQTVTSAEDIVTLWTIYEMSHEVKNLDGAYVSPIQ